MALEVTNLVRSFTFKKDNKTIELPDPNPEFSVQEVLKFYSGNYAELTNAIVEGPKVEGDKAKYSLTTKSGQLG